LRDNGKNEFKGRLKSILLRHEGQALATIGRELAAMFGIAEGMPIASSI